MWAPLLISSTRTRMFWSGSSQGARKGKGLLRIYIGFFVMSAGCGSATPSSAGGATVASSEPTSERIARQAAPLPRPRDGFVPMIVRSVSPGVQGYALILGDERNQMLIPIIVGEAEATVIDRRLRGEPFERPMTHDLLDALVAELGGEVVMVEVNKLRGNVFLGTIVIWDGHNLHRVDSRTSDAVAVALGADCPIYVHQSVIDDTGIGAEADPNSPAFPFGQP